VTVAAATEMPLSRARRPRGRVSKTAQVVGELLITFGLIVFLFIFYELKITDWKTADTQHRLSRQLATQWQPPSAPKPDSGPAKAKQVPVPPLGVVDGQGFAVLRIPRFGSSYRWVVVEGVSRGDLEEGPGHYPGTALPGQLGNMVVSGHRTTYGHPFNRFAEMRTGDVVSLQVRTVTYRYRVIRTQIVDPRDTAVIFPVPGNFRARPTQRLLTMTTCNPEYSAVQRLIVTAELTGGA
jgi:sortase A